MANPLSSLPRRLSARPTRPRGNDLHDGPPSAVVAVKKIFAAETGTFFVILGTTLFLVVFGLVMVLSSSSVEQYVATKDFFGAFVRQGVFAAIGVPAMLVVSRVPVWAWKKYSWAILIAAVGLQLLTLSPLGYTSGGNRNWIRVGSFSAQPSEAVKLGLCLWMAMILVKKRDKLDDWRQVAVPLLPVVAISLGLVVKGGDLGTTMIMLLLVVAAVFFAGVKLKFFIAPLLVLAVIVPVITSSASSRSTRISAWLSGCANSSQYQDTCWQSTHGMWALASGGLFGVGLGNSKAKWSWLPEADNDFIFAIIGEELGLIGACVVLALFIVLAVSFVKIIRRSKDAYVRIVTASVMAWIIGQAFVNIAVVLGLLPVLGVPLPLISAGGSALILTLVGIGVVLSFARHHESDDSPGQHSRIVLDERVGSLR